MQSRQDRHNNELKAHETGIAADRALGIKDGWQKAEDGANASVQSACAGSVHKSCK